MPHHTVTFARILLIWIVCASTNIYSVEIFESNNGSFEALRDAVEQHTGGYVHPDLGLLTPAPCGAERGIGWISASSSLAAKAGKIEEDDSNILLRIPLSFQMTRSVALDTITPLIPLDILTKAPLDELDDAALLVLLLVHERGLGKESKFHRYIESLPNEPSCGWAPTTTTTNTKAVPAPISRSDLVEASRYVSRVAEGMSEDYASYLAQTHWPGTWKESPPLAISWSLCVVSSRGTESSSGTRLVPLMDLINHDIRAVGEGFVELTTTGSSNDDDDDDDNKGAFVVRSHQSEWKVGEEIVVDYNLPDYDALDWFLSLGFIPSELLLSKEKSFSSSDEATSNEL